MIPTDRVVALRVADVRRRTLLAQEERRAAQRAFDGLGAAIRWRGPLDEFYAWRDEMRPVVAKRIDDLDARLRRINRIEAAWLSKVAARPAAGPPAACATASLPEKDIHPDVTAVVERLNRTTALHAVLSTVTTEQRRAVCEYAAEVCESQGADLPDDLCERDEYRRGQKRAALDCATMMRRLAEPRRP